MASVDLSSFQSKWDVKKMERNVSLINCGRARWEQRETCSTASVVTEGSTGENYVIENSSKLGHPSEGVEQWLSALVAS